MVDQWHERGINYYVNVKEGDTSSEEEGRGIIYEEDNTWIGLGKIKSCSKQSYGWGGLSISENNMRKGTELGKYRAYNQVNIKPDIIGHNWDKKYRCMWGRMEIFEDKPRKTDWADYGGQLWLPCREMVRNRMPVKIFY